MKLTTRVTEKKMIFTDIERMNHFYITIPESGIIEYKACNYQENPLFNCSGNSATLAIKNFYSYLNSTHKAELDKFLNEHGIEL